METKTMERTRAIPSGQEILDKQIKTAMGELGLEERAEDLLNILNEMELKRCLTASEREAEMGLGKPVDEVVGNLIRKIKDGN